MEVPLKMIDCENYQCVPLSVPSVGSAHPTAVLNSSKRPNLLLFRNSKACIEFIYSQNEFLIWGRTNSCNNLSNLSDYKTLTIEDGLDFGLWCKFGLSLDQQKPLDAFIMIKNSLLTAISFNGEYFQSKLTVVPKSVWSTSSFGLIVECKDVVCTSASLPSLYNLSHPCEELVPIICAFANENVEAVQISEFNSSMKSCIVASIASMDILITHDTKRGHRFWLVRKATDGEKEEFYHQRELKAFEVNITKARENAKTPGFHLDKNNSVFSPILKSAFHTQQKFRSPFSEKQSPMFRRSCRLTSQPLFQSSPFVNSTMSEAAHSTTQLSRNSHFLPWFEMPLTPNLCLELIANEASLSTKHTSKFVASKAFATHDFNAQQYVCLLIGQIESLVLFRVCTKLSKRNMEITKCGNISCVDAINVEKLPYMAILEKDSTVTLYSGTLRLCKVRCPDPLLATSLNIDGAVNRNNPGNSILNFHASLGRTVIANTFGVTNIVCLTLPKLFENPSVEMFLNSFKCCLTPPDFTQIALDWFVCRNAVGKTVDSQCEFSLFIAFVENEIGLNDCENGRRSRSIDSCSDSGSKKVKMTEFGTEKDFADMFETDYATNLALICGFEELTEVSGVDREKEVQISTAKLDKNFELVIKIAHVIYEELKLDASKELESRILAIFLASVAHKLEFNNWKMRYFVDFPAAIFPSYLLKNDQNVSSTAKKPAASVEANIDSHHAKANFPELQKFFSDNKTMCFLDWVQAVMNLGNISPGDFNETKKGKRIAGGTVGAEMDWKSTLAEQGTLNLNASSLITLPCIWGVTERLCKSAIVYIFYVCFNNSLPSLQIECELLSSVKGFLSQVLIDLAGREIPVDLVEKLDLLKLRASGKTERSPSEEKITVGREHLPAQEGTGSEENEEKFCEQILFLMIRLKIDSDFIHTLPPGIALPLFDVVHQCHLKPSLNWPKEAINLIKRQDLITQKEMLARAADLEVKGKTTWSAWSICPKLGTAKYYTKQENNAGLTSANRTSAGQNTSTNGLEMNLEVLDFLFPNDCRIQSVKRMLNSSQPVKIKAHHQQNDLQVKLAHYAKRTMALPVGRGMFALSSVAPCITSTEPIPEMNFSCKVMPKNVSVQITSSTLSFPARSWAFYHNGVATGLRIDQNIKDLDSAWVIYNRPKSTNSGENASAHAGFLLGLALNGHLDNMSTFNFHSYLCRNQEQTSISLLLGLCASKQATRDEVLFRTITLHIGALLPPNGAELDVGFNVQTAALLAAGFLFMSSGDKHMADVMLNQINRPPGPELENCINRESFSLAAGLSLGMIMLGKGRSLFGLSSGASFTSQLCSYIKGGANPHVNSQFTCDQIREGENINLLVTSPGASLATGLIFFNTCSRSIADWFTPPETALTIDTILPEHLLLHVVAKALVCWEEILFTSEWVGNNLPEFLKSVFARGIYSQEEFEDENLDFSCWQAYCNIIAGSCFSIGLRFAGSQNKGAFTLVFKFLEVFLILFESGKGFDANTGARTVFTCLQTCLTALCMIMSGSGNLQVLAIIRRLHCLVGPNIDYGQQMAVHMSLGLLFLGGCRYSLRNDPKAIAALLAALYPTYPISSDDNRYHLQAFRHLYVKACEPRLLLTRNVLNYKVEQALVKIVLKETKHYNEYEFETVTPCLVPQLDLISRIEVVNRYPNFQFLSIQTVLDDEKSRIDFAWILKSCLFVQSQSNETNYAYDTSFVKTKPPGFNSVTTFNLLRVNQNKQLFKIDSCNLDPAGCGLLRSTEDTFVGAFMESFKLSVESVNQSITSLLDLNVKTSLELLTIFAEIANNNTNMPQGHDKDFAENHGTSINSSTLTKSEEKSIIVRSESCLQNTKAVIKQLTLFRLFHELSPLNSLFPKKDPIDKSAKVSVGTGGKKPIKSGFVEQYSWLSCLTATISVKLIQQFHNCLHDDNSSVKKYLTNPSSLKGSEEEPPRAINSATVEPLPNVRPKSARLRNNSALLHKTSDAKPSGGLAESNLKPYLIKNSLTESQSDRNLSKLEDLHKSVSIKFDLSELNTLTNLLSILGISSPQIMRAAILGSLSTAEKEKSVERILKNDCGLFETVVQFRDRVVEQQGKIALTSTNQPGYNCESGGVGSDGGGNTKNTSSAVFSGYSVSCNSEIEKLLPPTPTQPLQQSDNFIQFDHILSSILSVSKGNGIKTTTRKNFDSNTKQNCFGGAFASLSDHQISLLLHTLCSVSVSSQLKKDLSQLTVS